MNDRFWPPFYLKNKLRHRELCVVASGFLVAETGEQFEFENWKSLSELIASKSRILIVDNMSKFQYLTEALSDENCSVICNQYSVIKNIRIRSGRRVGWIIEATTWLCSDAVDAITLMRKTLDLCHAGDEVSPAALGQKLMLESYKLSQGLQYRPNFAAGKDLHAYSIGGRSDTVVLGQKIDVVTELDVNSAYLYHAKKLPSGSCVKLSKADVGSSSVVTSVWRCRVTIPDDHPLRLGPFPVRDARPEGLDLATRLTFEKTKYPVQPGTYSSWLWESEIDITLEAGCTVERIEGWGWTKWTGCLSKWSDKMLKLRKQAEAHGMNDVACVVKVAGVAALGRFMSDGLSHTIKREFDPDSATNSRPLVVDGAFSDEYWTSSSINFSGVQLSHWYSYIMSEQRVMLYRKAYQAAVDGRLICTNYDAVYLQGEDPLRVSSKRIGGWKATILTAVTVPYSRAVLSNEKICLPGIDKKSSVRLTSFSDA
jgi:hypothetical protein